tara:strand:- start:23691 stop:23966 length:276 start_codon:yes stop_codon:yes gene_type:complete
VSASDDARSGMVILEHSNVRIRTKLMGANGKKSDRAPRINHIADGYRSFPTHLARGTTDTRAREVGRERTKVSNERTFSTNDRFPFVFLPP